MGFDDLLNTGAVPQDERMADFVAESRANRNFCYEAAERAARRVAEDPEAFRRYLDVQGCFLRYTANNALLILEQKPEARRLGDMAYWKERGGFVKRTERARPVLVMEPGKEYKREDNTYGQYYNAKKLYDVSQTTIPEREWQGGPREYEDYQLIRALISRAPVSIHTAGEEGLPEGVGAWFNPEEHSIYARKSMGADEIFRGISRELAHAEYAKGSVEYDRETYGFHAECASYILCRRYGIETEGHYALDSSLQLLEGLDPKEIKRELSLMRDAANHIFDRMEKSLTEQTRGQRNTQER